MSLADGPKLSEKACAAPTAEAKTEAEIHEAETGGNLADADLDKVVGGAQENYEAVL
jgi:hypothetical protein